MILDMAEKPKKPKPRKPAKTWTPAAIKALRDRLDLTQEECAARLRISQGQLSNLETGRREKPTSAIAHLLDLLSDGKI